MVEPPGELGVMLANSPLEGAVLHGEVLALCLEHPARQLGHERPGHVPHLAGALAGRVALVDEPALLEYREASRESAGDGLEREPAPPE